MNDEPNASLPFVIGMVTVEPMIEALECETLSSGPITHHAYQEPIQSRHETTHPRRRVSNGSSPELSDLTLHPYLS